MAPSVMTRLLSLPRALAGRVYETAIVLGAVVAVCLSSALASPLPDNEGSAVETMMTPELQHLQQDQHQQHGPRHRRNADSVPCEPPSNLTAMFESLNANVTPTQFLRPAFGQQAYFFPSGVRFGSSPPAISNLADPVAENALCPFRFRVLRLPRGYYPAAINLAECQCGENTGYICDEYRSYVTLHRPNGCHQGMQLYEEQRIRVPTACVCDGLVGV
ncbi:uncharacterized protein [Littorina saxatilis]|uniref:Uncharacterized protein n=1 Tax=Littorina saxatilis TaxID=31220 RepID=A0AAN9FV97_9CAEN